MANRKGPLYDPYSSVKSLLPVKTTSEKSVKNILSGLTSARTSELGIKALDGTIRKKTKPGLISTLFDQEKGIIAAPFRFTTALVGSAIGYPDDDLRGLNPLQAAARSARGDFAITGGDIFKVNDEDNFLERLPKYAAALGFDIVADPLSYAGGVGVFSRAGGARLMTDEVIATKLLDDAVRLVESKGGSGEALITKLVNNRRINMGAVEQMDPRRLAALELGDVVGETFLNSSRGQILNKLTNVLGDEDLARQLFTRLPDEIRGGLFLKNPVTGRPIVRIAGGQGYSNATVDALNGWRASLAASKAGRAVTRNLSGKVLGPGLAAVKKGLIQTNREQLGELARTRLSDITQLRTALLNRGNDIRNIPASFLKDADAIVSRIGKMSAEEAETFQTSFAHFFSHPKDITDETSPEIVKAAKGAADQLRARFDELSQELRAAGVDIGYQQNFVPLKYSDEELERLGRIDPRQGPETRDRYRGDLERKSYLQPVSIEELDAMNSRIVSEAMTPDQANAVMGRKVFETDPLKIMSFYTDWAAREISNGRMIKALEATGVLLRFPSDSIKILNIVNAKHYSSAISKLTPEAVARAEEAERAISEQLEDLVSNRTIRERERQRIGRINLAEESYNTAKAQETAVRKQLVELDRALRALEPDVNDIKRTIKGYGKKGLETELSIMRRLRESSRRRAARLTKAQAAKAADLEEARRILQMTETQGGEVRIWARDTEQYEDITIKPATREELRTAKREVKDATAIEREVAAELDEEVQTLNEILDEIDDINLVIEDATGYIAAEQVDNFREYLAGLERKRTLTAQYEGLRNNRRVAKRELDLSMSDVMMPRAKAVQTVVDGYMLARRNYLNFAATLRGIPKEELTAEQAARLASLKAASKDARWIMTNTLGFVGKNATQPGRAFAAQVVGLADRLTVQQINTARVIADAQKLGDFIQAIAYNGTSREAALAAMGDLMKSYRSIRRYVSNADLDMLNINERAVYEGLAETPLYEKVERKYTAKLEVLEKDLQAAYIRNAPDEEINELQKQIDSIHSLVREDGLRVIGANKGVRIPSNMKDIYASEGVRDVLERTYRIQEDPSEFQQFISKIYDPLSLLWKTGATVGRGPAYTLTNLAGGLFNNFIGGVGIQEHAVAAKVIHTMRNTINDVKLKMPDATERELLEAVESAVRTKLDNIMIGDKNAVEIFDKFLESGAWWGTDTVFQMQELRRLGLVSGQTGIGQREQVMYRFEGEPATSSETAFRRVVNFMLTNPVQRAFNDAAQQSEIFLRFAAFAHGYKRFGSRDAALDMVKMLHFDYQDLSDAEMWLKRIVPFYTWTRHNVPLQIRASFMQLDKIRKVTAGNQELQEAFGVNDRDQWLNDYLPDFIDTNSGFASFMKFGGNHLAVFPKLPIQDVDKLLMVTDIGGIPVPAVRLRETAQMVGPAVTPLEFLNQTNFDTGQKFRSNEEMVWQLSRSLVPYIGTAGRIVSAGTLVPRIAGVDVPLMEETGFPQKVYNQFVAPDKAQANLFNFLVGAPVGVSVLSEKALRGGIIERGEMLSKELKELAAKADVDYEWLRNEIKNGTTITQLRMKIAGGQGKTARVEREREAKSTGPSRDYVSFVRGLQTGRGTL